MRCCPVATGLLLLVCGTLLSPLVGGQECFDAGDCLDVNSNHNNELPVEEQAMDAMPDILILICTQSFTGEELVEDILLDLLVDTGRSFEIHLVDEIPGVDWTEESLLQAENNTLLLVQHARVVLIVASTYGDGDPPNHALQFADWLSLSRQQDVDDPIAFAVFGLGDKTYAHFCKFAEFVDNSLAARGGRRIVDLTMSDALQGDQSADFERWTWILVNQVLPQVLGPHARQQPGQQRRALFSSTGSDWRRSLMEEGTAMTATFVDKQELLLDDRDEQQQGDVTRSVLHVTFDLPTTGSVLDVQPGDHLGIYPRNDPKVVEQAIQWLMIINEDCKTTIMEKQFRHSSSGPDENESSRRDLTWVQRAISAREFLSEHVDLMGRATPATLRALLPFVGTLELRALARDLTFVDTVHDKNEENENDDNYKPTHNIRTFDRWVSGRRMTKLDLAMMFECRPSLQALARAMGPVQPRLYSISTVDQQETTTRVGICVAVVEHGLCTSFMSHRLVYATPTTVFARKSNFHFHHHGSRDAEETALARPAILVSAGSGIGPYVGFLQNEIMARIIGSRDRSGKSNALAPLLDIHLIFGARTEKEILYKSMLTYFSRRGGAKVHYALSREKGQPKRHVQDVLNSQQMVATLWNDVFERGGRVYACGRLEICDGVRNALLKVATSLGGMEPADATVYLQNMERAGRLLTDCWSVEDPPSRRAAMLYNNTNPQIPHSILRLERRHWQEAESCHDKNVANHTHADLSGVPRWPSYLRMVASGEFELRIEKAVDMFSACTACGRFCEVDRLSPNPEDWGECRIGQHAIVSAVDAHFGEEPCLRGVNGSGTIFFGACNLKCMYCQNWKISVMDQGELASDERLAEYMLHLQERGCHNINLVSPTHNILPIMRGIYIAAKNGLRLPIVFNSGGYDSVASLRLLDGIIDIYMPDAKYASRTVARKLSKIDNYPEINQAAIKEMHRQVGDLQIDPRTGLAYRGMLVRHLVLPNDYGGTLDVADFLTNEVSADTYTHVMKYYRPEHMAAEDTKFGMNRKPSADELQEAHNRARFAGLQRILY